MKTTVNEMKKLFLFFAATLLPLSSAGAQAQAGASQQQQGGASAAVWENIVGEVTAVDAASRRVTVRDEAGKTTTITMIEQSTYLLMPPGETQAEKGQPVTLADVRVGARVLVRASGGRSRRLVLMSKGDAPPTQQGARGGPGARDDGRRLGGRVVSVDAARKLIVVQARGREGAEAVTVDASGAARILRYAPDSMRPADAVAGSLADVRAGDNVRATGERSADGATFKAEEVLTGSFTRFAATVTSVDAAAGSLVVKEEQTGQAVTLAFGARSSLRRVTPEFEQAVAERAERFGRRQERRAARQDGQPQPEGRERRGEGRGEGQGGRRGEGGERRGDGAERRAEGDGQRRGGGNNIQQMLEGLPVVTLAELKKGDAVLVTATPGADASRATVVSLVTGAAGVLRAMQQFQRGPEAQRGMSPGLPGDVIGGGQGGTTPREPPR
jgi:hypothetical protein